MRRWAPEMTALLARDARKKSTKATHLGDGPQSLTLKANCKPFPHTYLIHVPSKCRQNKCSEKKTMVLLLSDKEIIRVSLDHTFVRDPVNEWFFMHGTKV